MDKFLNIWSNLIEFGKFWIIWTNLDNVGKVWTTLNKFFKICTILDKFGHCWKNFKKLNRVGQVWTNLEKDIFRNIVRPEIPTLQVFLGADAQLLWTSVAGTKMALYFFDRMYVAQLCHAHVQIFGFYFCLY